MKSAFSKSTLFLVAVALVLSTALVASAQTRDKFVISAQAGGVNAISGRTETRSAPSADWQLLNVTDDLRAGDFVRTGGDGMVEMLLNPGAYLRVAENSEFQLTNNTLESLEIKLLRGTGIIEATGSEETELAINITTPHAKMVIVRRGLYRVNVVPGNTTELIVRKGRVLLADSHTRINSGNKVVFNSTSFSVAKLRSADKQKDAFESWSKQRAGTLALANQRISARTVNTFLSDRSSWSSQFSGRSLGIWYYDGRYGCFSFLPFLFGWGSPYGDRYPSTYYFGPYGCCGGYGRGGGRIFTRPPTSAVGMGVGTGPSSTTNSGPTRTGTRGTGSSGSGSGGTRVNPPATPPTRDPGGGMPARKSEPTLEPGRRNR